MDRYAGPEDEGQEEAHYAQILLLLERQEWERDQAAIAEYESWWQEKESPVPEEVPGQ